MAKPYLVGSTSRAGGYRAFIKAGGGGYEVVFGGAHLMDGPGHELP